MSNVEITLLLTGLLLLSAGFSWLLATFNHKSSFSKFWFQGRWDGLFEGANKRAIYILGGGFGVALIVFGLGFFAVAFVEAKIITWLLFVIGSIALLAAVSYSINLSRRR